MPDPVIRVGTRTDQGKRSNNEDAFVADAARGVYLVADGMGGQEHGELASALAVQIIPEAVRVALASGMPPEDAIRAGVNEAHLAVVRAGVKQNASRKMGTTLVMAVAVGGAVYVVGFGDSPAFLVRDGKAERLTADHTVADELARKGTITAEQVKNSPFRNMLYRFLGCAEMRDEAEVRRIDARPGDHVILASDGLSGFVGAADLVEGAKAFADVQAWADHLVQLALSRGSRDNVTCVVMAVDG